MEINTLKSLCFAAIDCNIPDNLNILPDDLIDELPYNISFKSQIRIFDYCRLWHSNGKLLMHAQYLNGIQHGPTRIWYLNGGLRMECNYVNSAIHGVQKWYHENGMLGKTIKWKNGKKDGKQVSWWRNGKMRKYKKYANGLLTGISCKLWDNGMVFSVTGYIDGKEQGYKYIWTSTGMLCYMINIESDNVMLLDVFCIFCHFSKLVNLTSKIEYSELNILNINSNYGFADRNTRAYCTSGLWIRIP